MRHLLFALILVVSVAHAQTTKVTYRTDSTVISTGTPVVTVTNNSDSQLVTLADGSVANNIYALVNTTTTTPTTSRDLRYEITTTVVNGKTVTTQRLISDTVVTTNKVTPATTKELIQTVLVSGPTNGTATTATVTARAQSVPVDYVPAAYSAATYYNSPYLGTPTPVFSNDPRAWIGSESVNRANEIVGANYAWARGWTGLGSTIMIMDSGIDTKSTEFAGKIKYQLDLTNTGIQDVVGHGTHVAGVAAAARNGTGINGVAFDANLAIAKISNTTNIGMGGALSALAWASQYNDIVVANLSANTVYSSAYTASVKNIAPGIYTSSDVIYGGKNYYNLERPEAWASVLSPRMVLTVSAGNSSLPYVQNPATFANATDANGKLVLNGQMLVVGNWNDQAGRIEGAQAGSVCKTLANNVCQDKYRVSDFYILAPGMAVRSTVPTTSNITGYQSMSGTSQAAPVVAGAVALINQMWPYMTAENQVQLLLKTANKNIPGYNVDTHGQGLLDLNRATQPVGSLGISLTGRTGTTVPIQGGITLSAMVGQAKTTLSSISAVDSLQRDFTVNMSGGVNTNSLMSHPMLMDADPGFNWSGRWTGLVAGQNQALPMSGLQTSTDSTITIDSRLLAPKSRTLHQFTVTNSAYNPYVNFSGAWGQSGGATTVEYSALDRDTSGWWTQWGVMSTQVKYSSGLVNNVTPIVAVHGMAGFQTGAWNFFGGVKPTVMYGEVKMNVPTSVDADGNMNYSSARTNLASVAPVGYVGVKWQHDFARGQTLAARAAVAQDGTSNIKVYYTHAL
jgi:subtilisin family serine protease